MTTVQYKSIIVKRLKLLIFLAPALFHGCDSEKAESMWYTDITPDQTMTSMIPFPWTVADLNENSIVSATSTGHNSIVSSAVALRGYDLNNDGLTDFDFHVTHSLSRKTRNFPICQ